MTRSTTRKLIRAIFAIGGVLAIMIFVLHINNIGGIDLYSVRKGLYGVADVLRFLTYFLH